MSHSQSRRQSNIAPINAMSAWHIVLRCGNEHFEHQRFERARAVYADALALAHAHLYEWPCADDGLGAVTVSALNLVATYTAMNELSFAASEMSAIHGWLLQIGRSSELPDAMRLAALKYVNRTFVELKRFQIAHGEFPQIEHWLHNSCTCVAWAEISGASQTRH